MRATILVLVTAFGLTAVAATAQGPAQPQAGRQVTICLDASGQRHQALCQRGTEVGDRYVCHCTGGLTAVTAPACDAGESPPQASAASSAAMKAALTTGTLNKVEVDGRRMCVATRHVAG
ncbi:MAG TPA: hypothetical protein VG407_12290 [Caulobacteraceae bacterium]|jgi:hypothetical protein|nr:hypothetical protein [Caulobacteraceae bacterium]